jgi:hypothetical protein
MRKLLILGLALCLTACVGETHLAFTQPPPDKLVCADEPGRPEGSGELYTDANGVQRHAITDDDNAAYLRDLRATGQDCRDDVNWLRDWFASLAKKK